jgi:D-glycero-alpha-D-manno-heptose-7-phosphate kinase
MLHHARVARSVAVRAPLRISLGGGGTDLPSHYADHGGFVLSAAIDRYVRVRVGPAPGPRFRLEHLATEEVDDVSEVQHPILRAALARHGDGGPLALSSTGDVPPGTGLGSSGAYTVGAVHALELAAGHSPSRAELAEAACRIELGDMGRTVGKQDQYAAAFGGVNALTFDRDGTVHVRPLELGPASRRALDEQFLLFSAGGERSAADMLAGQVERTLAGDAELHANLSRTEELARQACAELEADEPAGLCALMEEQWALKRERLTRVPMERVVRLREHALEAGAGGVMLMGAGGGGFLLVCGGDPEAVRHAMRSEDAPEMPFGVDDQGCVAE